MATMSATMKQFTKGLKTTFEPMQTSLASIEQSLLISASKEATREEEVEAARLAKKAADEEAKQTTWLKKLFGKKDEKGEGGGFFTKHWGKILTALAGLLLFLPKDFLKEKLFNPQWWKDQATTIGGWIAGAFLAKKTWDLAGETFGFALKAWMLKNMMGGGIGRMFGFGGGGGTTKKGEIPKKGGKGGRMLPVLSKLGKIVGWAWAAGSLLSAQETFSEEGFSAGMGKFWETMWGGVLGDKKQVKDLLDSVGQKIKDASGEITKTFIKLATADYKKMAEELWAPIKEQLDKAKLKKEQAEMIPSQDVFTKENTSKEVQQKIYQKQIKQLNTEIANLNHQIGQTKPTVGGMKKRAALIKSLRNAQRRLPLVKEQLQMLLEGGPVNPTGRFSSKQPGYTSDGQGGGYTGSDLQSGNAPSQGMFFRTWPIANWYDSKSHRIRMNRFGDHPTDGTRATSWSKLNPSTQTKVNFLAERLGQIVLTSGWRTQQSNKAAMINRLDPLGGVGGHVGADGKFVAGSINTRYKTSWRKAILKKFGQAEGSAMLMDMGHGTDITAYGSRAKAVEFLSALPDFGGPHGHGNAIDMKYPAGYGKDASGKAAFAKLVKDIFPGSTVYDERGHLHVGFNAKISPDDIKNAWNAAHTENREANLQFAAGGGGGGQAVINNAPTNIKEGDSTVLAGSYHAQDNGIWNEQVASSNHWR